MSLSPAHGEHGGLGVVLPAGSRGTATGQGVGNEAPLTVEAFSTETSEEWAKFVCRIRFVRCRIHV